MKSVYLVVMIVVVVGVVLGQQKTATALKDHSVAFMCLPLTVKFRLGCVFIF